MLQYHYVAYLTCSPNVRFALRYTIGVCLPDAAFPALSLPHAAVSVSGLHDAAVSLPGFTHAAVSVNGLMLQFHQSVLTV